MNTETHRDVPIARYDFIDALRGIAILMVILVHAQQKVAPSSAWLQSLMAGGARGVQLFYIASAMTLGMSWDARSSRERSPIRNFYLRRWFRIAPMFYIAIALYVMLYGMAPREFAPNGIRWYYIPLTALFLNGFHPETITSVVPGGWSIVVEMTFYLVLPVLVTRFRSLPALLALIAIGLVADRATGFLFRRIYLPQYSPEHAALVDNFTFLNFFSQFPVFAIGLLAYAIYRRPAIVKPVVIAGAITFGSWLFFWLMRADFSLGRVLSMHVPIGAGFAVLALALSVWPVGLLVNRLTQTIGRLSFSMYLAHFVVLEAFAALHIRNAFGTGNAAALLHYGAVVTTTAAISWMNYTVIERPGVRAGSRLIARLEHG